MAVSFPAKCMWKQGSGRGDDPPFQTWTSKSGLERTCFGKARCCLGELSGFIWKLVRSCEIIQRRLDQHLSYDMLGDPAMPPILGFTRLPGWTDSHGSGRWENNWSWKQLLCAPQHGQWCEAGAHGSCRDPNPWLINDTIYFHLHTYNHIYIYYQMVIYIYISRYLYIYILMQINRYAKQQTSFLSVNLFLSWLYLDPWRWFAGCVSLVAWLKWLWAQGLHNGHGQCRLWGREIIRRG